MRSDTSGGFQHRERPSHEGARTPATGDRDGARFAPPQPGDGVGNGAEHAQDLGARNGGRPSAAVGEARRAEILALVNAGGSVRIGDLAERLAVSEPTVRKDLTQLEREGHLRRTHGGAIARSPVHEPALPARAAEHAGEKLAIARAAARLVEPGDSVFIDAGTTMTCLAEVLEVANVNVLTNALAVAQTLAGRASIRHTVLGGIWRPVGGCFIGPLAVANLRGFTVNTAFIGISGLTEEGISVADYSEAQLKVAAMERSRRVVVLADASKCGATDFALVAPLARVNTLVTYTPPAWVADLARSYDIELIDAAL